MSMNFYLEISVSLAIVVLVLHLCYIVIPNKPKVRDFFVKHQRYISPNCISNWRKHLGIPVIGFYVYGVYTANEPMVYITIWIFVFLAITDLLDGVVARRCGLETEEGAKLDAEADKWFDLPALFTFSFFPVFEPMYLICVVIISIFDIIGQIIRGRHSAPGAVLVGKTKTAVKFILIYLMSLNGRYQDIYEVLKLEDVILTLLIIAPILAGLSMGMKTKLYQEDVRKYFKEYLK